MHRKRKHSQAEQSGHAAKRTSPPNNSDGGFPADIVPNCAGVFALKGPEMDVARRVLVRVKRENAWAKFWMDNVHHNTLIDLNIDVLGVIWSWLSSRDVLSMLSVCRRSRLLLYNLPQWDHVLNLLGSVAAAYEAVQRARIPQRLRENDTSFPMRQVFAPDIYDVCLVEGCTQDQFVSIILSAYSMCDVHRKGFSKQSTPYTLIGGIRKIEATIRAINYIRKLQTDFDVLASGADILNVVTREVFPIRFLFECLYWTRIRNDSYATSVNDTRSALGLSTSLKPEDRMRILSLVDSPQSSLSLGEKQVARLSRLYNAAILYTRHEPVAVSIVGGDARSGLSIFCAVYLDQSSNPMDDFEDEMIGREHVITILNRITRVNTIKDQRPFVSCEYDPRYQHRAHDTLERFIEDCTQVDDAVEKYGVGNWILIPSAGTWTFLNDLINLSSLDFRQPVPAEVPLYAPRLAGLYIYRNQNGDPHPSTSFSSAILTRDIIYPLIEGKVMSF